MERKCPECGERVTGRSDKKFCSDQCRTSYNNRRNNLENKILRSVNSILKKNRDILADINRTGKTTVSGKRLAAEGFNFSYFTSIYTTKAGKIYRFCYEQGYLQIDERRYALVRKEAYAG